MKASPAPSASLVPMMGVWTYKNPFCWKKRWVASASAFLTLATADMVFVLALKWSWDLKNSNVVFFLAIG